MATTAPDINLEHLKQFRFKELFNELGWDQPAQQQPYAVAVGEKTYELDVVAHKRGVQILQCRPDEDGRIPEYSIRQKIERKATSEVAREHLIVFSDAAKSAQIWQWVSRLPGKTVQYRELALRDGETNELLRQKLSRLRFTLDEEELLTVLGVTGRLDDAIPRDRVTKKFYTDFEKQREAFAEFIKGIPATGEDLRWYTAVLIDRLIFLWFLQEKSFLDGKKTYLQERLDKHLASKPKASFYSIFLCPLFFRGFAEERNDANRASLKTEFGDVPYLNGGLFAEHSLERQYSAALDVDDSAFERLFTFFAEWDWHLDDRPLRSGREINPDVLGYIFEKFVNQKQMGAYYTKEDITEYIGKNTIIPTLLHKVRSKYPGPFDAFIWPLLKADPDRYIYPAMLKGVDIPYPTEIEVGRAVNAPDLLQRRRTWNKKTPDAWALPTEIWRETIARHDRTREVRAKLADDQFREIGDLITYNLDIRRFAQDVIERCTDLALLREFWAVLAGRVPRKASEKLRPALSVLDPTCGSGAFLFAALNILKPLYDAALGTMAGLLLDADQAGDKTSVEKWKDIEETVERFAALRDDRARDYAVIKHIIVQNLYGVDIEEQATEIAKLRLFLKLVSLLEPGDTIEPLPDIDFNIRHGNTLVGYATAIETEGAVRGQVGNTFVGQGKLFSGSWEDIRVRLAAVEEAYHNFQIQQVRRGGQVTPHDKQALASQLGELEEMLNHHLCRTYGKDPTKTKQYNDWKASHKPFHWYVDFYPLMASGGFDVVIGNPPWAEYSSVRNFYSVKGYKTVPSGNLYGLCTERSLVLARPEAFFSFIVQLPVVSSSRMSCVRSVLRNQCTALWIATFDDRPGKLFDGIQHCRATIFVASCHGKPRKTWTTRYHRWPTTERARLLPTLVFVPEADSVDLGRILPKYPTALASGIFQKVAKSGGQPLERYRIRHAANHYVFYQEATQYWVKATSALPFYSKNGIESAPAHGRYIYFDSTQHSKTAMAVLNSSLFYLYFVAYGDCFHLSDTLASQFSTPLRLMDDNKLVQLSDQLMRDLLNHAERKTIASRRAGSVDRIEYDEYNAAQCKTTIDDIDLRLAQFYRFSEEESDFLINYDIKYRVGLGVDEESDD